MKQIEKKPENAEKAMRKMSFRKAAAAAAVALATLVPAKAIAGGFMNVQPAFNTEAGHATIRLEGGTTLKGMDVYGFADLDATKQRPADIEGVYAEFRVSYPVAKALGLAAEYNCGTGTKDTVRLGAVVKGGLWKGNFTLVKVFPVETSGEKGPQVSIYLSQDIGKKIAFSVLADVNTRPGTVYLEPELMVRITETAALFVQARGFGKIGGKMGFEPVTGVKIQPK